MKINCCGLAQEFVPRVNFFPPSSQGEERNWLEKKLTRRRQGWLCGVGRRGAVSPRLCLSWDEISPTQVIGVCLHFTHLSVSWAGQSRPPLPGLPSRCILQTLQGAGSVSQRITAPSPWASRATAGTSVDAVPAELSELFTAPVLCVL